MSDDHTGHTFQEQLRSLSQAELDELYVRLRGLANHLLKNKFGYAVRAIEPEELVHQVYIAVESGHRGDGNATSLFQFLARVMRSELDHIVRPMKNKAVHLSIALSESDDDGTVHLDGLIAAPNFNPAARFEATELLRRIIARVHATPLVLRYVTLRAEAEDGPVEEEAAALGVTVKAVRSTRKTLARVLRRLRKEDSLL